MSEKTETLTLDTQAAKFTNPVETKTPTTSATDAAATVTGEAAAKKTAVEVFATIPTLDAGFTYVVESAAVNATTASQVDVKITITETAGTAGSNTKEVTLKVTGLALSTLEIQAKQFTDFAGTAKDTTQKTDAAAATITSAADAAAKLKALEALTTTAIPTVVEGFTFEIKSAAPNATTKTQLDVMITVTQVGNNTPQEVILKITGFTTPDTPAGN